jgi:hypothetical protein
VPPTGMDRERRKTQDAGHRPAWSFEKSPSRGRTNLRHPERSEGSRCLENGILRSLWSLRMTGLRPRIGIVSFLL